MSLIQVINAQKYIKQRPILNDISLNIDQGSIVGFTGENGSGKTMLLKAISGFISLTSGEILIRGQRFNRTKQYPLRLGLMFDASNLWSYKTGKQTLELLGSIQGVATSEDICTTLQLVGLDPNDRRLVKEYSLGMKQRLNLAQAIFEKPELLILDEPTNALDIDGINLVRNIIIKEHNRGTTILVSCHNQPQLEELFDVHARMSGGKIAELVIKNEN